MNQCRDLDSLSGSLFVPLTPVGRQRPGRPTDTPVARAASWVLSAGFSSLPHSAPGTLHPSSR